MGFNEGRLAGFVALLLISALTFLYAKKSMSKMPKIRAISGLNGMEEAIGRATEMGKPIHFSPGTAALVSEDAPQVFAALSVLEWVGKKAAQKGNNKIICTIRYPEVMPLAQEALKRAYNSEGRADLYSDDMVRYLSTAQFAYAAGTIAIMEREQIAANFMMGSWIGESLILLEVGNKIGAIQVSGCARLGQIPFFVAASDYAMIGDELFAAAALVSGDAVQITNIRAQDIVKLSVVLVLLVGFVLKTFGIANLDTILLQ